MHINSDIFLSHCLQNSDSYYLVYVFANFNKLATLLPEAVSNCINSHF